MNVFYLDHHTQRCASKYVDKHVVKMIVEYAQLLSTAHRVLDGEEYEGRTANNRRIRRFKMADSKRYLIERESGKVIQLNCYLSLIGHQAEAILSGRLYTSSLVNFVSLAYSFTFKIYGFNVMIMIDLLIIGGFIGIVCIAFLIVKDVRKVLK